MLFFGSGVKPLPNSSALALAGAEVGENLAEQLSARRNVSRGGDSATKAKPLPNNVSARGSADPGRDLVDSP